MYGVRLLPVPGIAALLVLTARLVDGVSTVFSFTMPTLTTPTRMVASPAHLHRPSLCRRPMLDFDKSGKKADDNPMGAASTIV